MKTFVELTIERVHCNLCFQFILENIIKKYYPKNELEILIFVDLEVIFDLVSYSSTL